MERLLKKLSEASGPAGFEGGASSIAESALAGVCTEISRDRLGSLVAFRRCGAERAPLLMIDAHIDEIGFIITGVDEDGFLKFAPVGGLDARVLPDAEVTVLTDPPIPGIVCCLPPHVQSAAEMEEFAKTDALAIDIGYDREKASALVKPGTFAVSAAPFCALANNRFAGKALDNRACVAAVIAALDAVRDEKLDYDIAFVASVQEELGTRGAKPAAFGLNPDAAIVLDVTFGASPDAPKNGTFALGEGITLCVGPAVDRVLTDRLFRLAEGLGVPCHPEVYGRDTGTNATPIQVTRAGIPVAVISIPIRNMHTPCEVVDFTDIESAVKLLAAFIRETKGADLRD